MFHERGSSSQHPSIPPVDDTDSRWMAKSGSGETLPSGTQRDELMQELHEHLWRRSEAGAAQEMDRAEFRSRSARGERLEIIKVDGDDNYGTPSQAVDGPGSTPDETGKPTVRVGEGARGASSPTDGASLATESSGHGGDHGDSSGNPPSSGSRPWNPDDAGTTMTVRDAMPENWVHPYSLLICYFSNISEDPDPNPDLDPDLWSTVAPPNKKARIFPAGPAKAGESCGGDGEEGTGAQCMETRSGKLSRRSLSLLGKVKDSHSGKDAGDKNSHEGNEFRVERCLEAFAGRLFSSRHRPKDVLAESVERMAGAVRAAGKTRRDIRRQRSDVETRLAHVDERRSKVELLKLEIRTLEEIGMPTDAQKARMRLVALLRQPLPFDLPLGPGDADSGDLGSIDGCGGVRSDPVDGNGATVSGGTGGVRSTNSATRAQ